VTEIERKRQYTLFESQIALAIEVGKPLMIHTRSAHEEMLAILRSWKQEHGDKLRGNIHFFTAGYATAKQYFDLGFTISFPGVITFSSDYDDAVSMSPLERIMAETDSPYAAPVPHRGRRNTPAYIDEIYRRIATLRNQDSEVVRRQLTENAIREFKLVA
jgi:TatD DNase family protein